MPNPTTLSPPAAGTVNADLRGAHYDLLKTRVPAWFSQASPQRQTELGNYELDLPTWYRSATPAQQAALSSRHTAFREALNQLETRLASFNDVFDFAEQPLKDAIMAQFKLDLDVRNVYFARKYTFKERDDFFGFLTFDQQKNTALNHEYRGISLLEAALANFEPQEARPARCNDCQIITGWGSYDGDIIADFPTVNAYAQPIAPHDFAKLCRTLDLGKRYQQHIDDVLQPTDPAERTALEQQLEEHQRQHLAVSIEIARQQYALKPGSRVVDSGISDDVYRMLQQLLVDPLTTTLGGRAVMVKALTVFDIELVGPLLIGPSRDDASQPQRLTVYLPNDPQQPLKEYANGAAFMADLRTRLHSAAYRRFFSRFIPTRQQGEFFKKFNKLYQPSGSHSGADYPLVTKPGKLPLDEAAINGPLWQALRLATVAKVRADARAVAVPTEDEDSKARQERLDSYLDAVVSVFNLAAFVVPGLGPIMLAVGAIQMCHEVYEGFEAYENGETREMWAHFSSVALNVAFIGTGAKVLPHVQVSSVVDNLRPVTLATGERKLWKPDLSPYSANITLAADAQPDALGLYSHQARKVLRLDGESYQVKEDNGQYRIQHPTRPTAYEPLLEHNHEGAWTHEAEEPLTWDGPTLLRRLGHEVQALGAEGGEQLQTASGIDTDTLRAVHVDQQPLPLLLADSLRRFRLHRQISTFIDQLGSADPAVYAKAELDLQMQLMQQGGLFGSAPPMQILDTAGEVLWDDPAPPATARRRVVISAEQRARGETLKQVLHNLQGTDPALKEIPGKPSDSLDQRAAELRQYLAQRAQSLKSALVEERYRAQTRSDDADVQRVLHYFPGIPGDIARMLLGRLSDPELAALRSGKRLPQPLDDQARWAEQQTRASRAYEGLFHDTLATLDSQRLALRTLETLPGWVRGTRVELRQYSAGGEVLDAIGSPDTGTSRSVVLNASGDYDDLPDLYSALWRQLTPTERQALGFRDASELKRAIVRAPLPRGPLLTVLQEHPLRKPAYDASMRLLGGGRGLRQWVASAANTLRTPQARTRKLFKGFSDRDVDAFIESLGADVRGGLTRLETEYATLRQDLNKWVYSYAPPAGSAPAEYVDVACARVAAVEIRRCWRRQSYKLSLVLAPSISLPTLAADFSHIQELSLNRVTWSASADSFLKGFTGLKRLTVHSTGLAQLPEAIGAMRQLDFLRLASNGLRLNAQSAAALASLDTLTYLDLSNNPLGVVPDFSAMTRLEYLFLHNTGLDQWPTGIADHRQLKRLDLRDNQLREVPADRLEPAPEQLEQTVRVNGVIAMTGNPFPAEVGEQVDNYWQRLSQQHPEGLDSGITDGFSVDSPMISQVRHIHPNMTYMRAREMIWSLGDGAGARLTQLVQEFDRLHEQLNAWVFSGGGARQRYIRQDQVRGNALNRNSRYEAKARILSCWLRETPVQHANDGTPFGLELDLSGLDLPSLPDLEADFSHVGSLKLNNLNLSASPEGFLATFRGLRWLQMKNNQLRELPPALEQMHGLTKLWLDDNQIRLSEQTAQILASRTTLRILWLDGNPLGVYPDFSALTDLRGLSMRDTGLTEWPAGLGEQPLLEVIDLDDNQLTRLPQTLIAPTPEQLEQSRRISRITSVRDNPFSEATLQQVRDYAGQVEEQSPNTLVETALNRAAPVRILFDAGPFERWTAGLDRGQRISRKGQWQSLQAQPGAGGFFDMLADLPNAGAEHADLQQRVWAVIDSITQHNAESEALRERMFEWAGRAACCDRAALSFSNVEVMAMVDNARANASDQTQAASLIKLSRRLFRLDEVEKIAQDDIATRTAAINDNPGLSAAQKQRQIQMLEEVEIRLAYRVGLKAPQRLDLPGQPSRTLFTSLGHVSQTMLNAAQAKVLALNNSPQEIQALLSREFWQDFVTGKYRARFDALSKPYHEKLAALHEQVGTPAFSTPEFETQARDIQAQLAVEEAALIDTLTRQELVEHPLG